MSTHKEYLGDSVYAEQLDDGSVVLTTDNGMGASNTIILEPAVLKALGTFNERAPACNAENRRIAERAARGARNLTDLYPRMRVAYIPTHAHGDINHPDVERGAVSSKNDKNVFVRFDKAVSKLGWDGATSQSCDPADLTR